MVKSENATFLDKMQQVRDSLNNLGFSIERNPMFIDNRYFQIVNRKGNACGTVFETSNKYKVGFNYNNNESIIIDISATPSKIESYFEHSVSLPILGSSQSDYTGKNFIRRTTVTEIQSNNGDISIKADIHEAPIRSKVNIEGKDYVSIAKGDIIQKELKINVTNTDGKLKQKFDFSKGTETYSVEKNSRGGDTIKLEPIRILLNEEYAYDDINQLKLNVDDWIDEFITYKKLHPKHEEDEENSDKD